MESPYGMGPTDHLLSRMLLFVCCISLAVMDVIAQRDPKLEGELRIHVEGGSTRTIQVLAESEVCSTQCDWYPYTSRFDYWGKSNTNYYLLSFVDRDVTCSPYSPPDTPTIGYGKYMVIVGTDYIFVDFRDADYGTLTGYSGYQDMVLRFTPGYEYVVSDYGDTIQLGDTYHVWDMQPKQSAVKIPVTVQNDFSGSEGGTVTVDGVPQTSPYRTLWTLGNHTVEVAAKVNPDWYFD